jgi:hypothetical protein
MVNGSVIKNRTHSTVLRRNEYQGRLGASLIASFCQPPVGYDVGVLRILLALIAAFGAIIAFGGALAVSLWVRDSRPGDPWGTLAGIAAALVIGGLALVWTVWRLVDPPNRRPPA